MRSYLLVTRKAKGVSFRGEEVNIYSAAVSGGVTRLVASTSDVNREAPVPASI
jgi:hypothetical protein